MVSASLVQMKRRGAVLYVQAVGRPQFVEKVRDIVGQYLCPPDRAIVLSMDEKSQVQALDPHPTGLADAPRHPGPPNP